MRIEHFAFQVSEPAAFAAWYERHLGMKTVRATGAPTYTHFLVASDGAVLLEVYRNEMAEIPDYATQDPLIVHLAFTSPDPRTDMDRLLAAGATLQTEPTTTGTGDLLIMLRDPWGFPIQLCKRAASML